MNFLKMWSWKKTLLACLIVVVAHAQSGVGHTAQAAPGRTCESLRREMSLLFEQIYEKMPSLLNVMMGTAHDPTTGKRIEFGVDVMKNMILNTFTSFLPPCSHPSHGREHGHRTAPDGYIPKMHRSMGLPARIYTKGNSQKRVLGGLGGKLRRRRSSSSTDAKITSDQLIIGDVGIPLELFQQVDKGGEEEEKQTISLDIVV